MKKAANRPAKVDQIDPVNPMSTASKLASEHGVSEPTVKRAGVFAAAVDIAKEVMPVYPQDMDNQESVWQKEPDGICSC